jgi:hypothetical protein
MVSKTLYLGFIFVVCMVFISSINCDEIDDLIGKKVLVLNMVSKKFFSIFELFISI